jgi:hypothetical protein
MNSGIKTPLVLMAQLTLLLVNQFFFYSCKNDKEETDFLSTGNVQLNITHEVDGEALLFDSLIYQNAAGNYYSVSRLQYYLSNAVLKTATGKTVFTKGFHYIDATRGDEKITLPNIPAGTYTSIQFLIGLDSLTNQSYNLPNTLDNINMSWPDVMGGGYHFIKLEGQYLNTNGAPKGYAMHLGTNAALVRHQPLNILLTVEQNKTSQLTLAMNINAWYTQPYNYNFITDGNYTMGIPELMQLIRNNGKDVFETR